MRNVMWKIVSKCVLIGVLSGVAVRAAGAIGWKAIGPNILEETSKGNEAIFQGARRRAAESPTGVAYYTVDDSGGVLTFLWLVLCLFLGFGSIRLMAESLSRRLGIPPT